MFNWEFLWNWAIYTNAIAMLFVNQTKRHVTKNHGDVMGYVNDVANKKQHSDSFQEVDDRRGGFNDLYNGTVPNSMSMWIH